MTQSTNKPSSDETNGLPGTAEQSTTSRPNSPLSAGSDNDGSEKPVRERLKKASIGGLSAHVKPTEDKGKSEEIAAESPAEEEKEDIILTESTPSLRGRPTRKRSFDDLQNESTTSIDAPAHDDTSSAGIHHKRMRSRDISGKTAGTNGKTQKEQVAALTEEEDDEEAEDSPGGAGIMVEAPSIDEAATSRSQSPKKKRSRDQFDSDQGADTKPLEKEGDGVVVREKEQPRPDEEMAKTSLNGDKGEPEKKRHRDSSEEGREAGGTEAVAVKVCTAPHKPCCSDKIFLR